MFFLIGWGKQTIRNYGTISQELCERCHNEVPWQLISRRTWITLFFIPVIPYSNDKIAVCPVCSNTKVFDNSEFENLKDKLISNEESELYLAGKTEVQRNYIKQMRELEKNKN